MGNSDTTPSSAAPHPQAGTGVRVYCASRKSADPKFREAAARLGREFAGAGCSAVFGGGAFGSLGPLAAGALEAGGRGGGIQPSFMADLEWTHPRLTEIHLVESRVARKSLMLKSCDAVVTLPRDRDLRTRLRSHHGETTWFVSGSDCICESRWLLRSLHQTTRALRRA